MRKTKIVCTIGPATNSEVGIKLLVESGMNVARVNMSHGSNEEHIETIKTIKKVRKEMCEPIGIMVDLKGPEVRIGKFETGKIELKKGDNFVVDSSAVLGNKTRVGVSVNQLFESIKKGQKLLLSDGAIEMVVQSIKGKSAVCKVVCGGTLTNNKSINLPGLDLNLSYLSEVDKLDILMAISQNVDFLALSFVQSASDVFAVKKFIEANNGSGIKLIAKIESQKGVKNMAEIIDAADGVMVARGDLGVEVDFVKLPHIQNQMLEIAQKKHKMSITATQMLVSMVKESRPTRAEITDIANAIISGSGAVMLSEETAVGVHPALCVKTMAKIALECEKHIQPTENIMGNKSDGFASVCFAAVSAAKTSAIKNIVVATGSGRSAQEISAYRPNAAIVAFSQSKSTYYQMSLMFGVQPNLIKVVSTGKGLWNEIKEKIQKNSIFKAQNKIIYVSGDPTSLENTIMEIKQI